jgi:FtsH-binding integral membrane protein
MVKLVLGIVAAMGASVLYSLGITLQAMDARQAPYEEHLRVALVVGLVRRARWLLGTGLSMLGWPLQVLALLLAPLVVVQPALAVGLLVLLFFGERMLGEHAGRYEHMAMLAIVLGVLGTAVFAPPRHASPTGQQLTITLVLLGLSVVCLLPYLLRAFGHSIAEVTMVCAGLAGGWSGVATKLASDDLAQHHLVVAALWGLSTAAAGGVGVLSEMSALQSRPAIQVAPVVFVTQTIVPVAVAPLLFGERFGATPLAGVPLSVSLAVLIGGAALLARSPLLTTAFSGGAPLMEAERISEPSGSAPSPVEPNHVTMRSSPLTDADDPSSSTTSTSPARIGR